MSPAYLDSSAIVKLVVREPETDALQRYLSGAGPLATSILSTVEVARAVARVAPRLSETLVALFEAVAIVALDARLASRAAALDPANLRTLDANSPGHCPGIGRRADRIRLLRRPVVRRRPRPGTARGGAAVAPGRAGWKEADRTWEDRYRSSRLPRTSAPSRRSCARRRMGKASREPEERGSGTSTRRGRLRTSRRRATGYLSAARGCRSSFRESSTSSRERAFGG